MTDFKDLARQLEELADELDLDMLQPTILPDMAGDRDVLRVAFVTRDPEGPAYVPTGDDEFDAIMSRFK